MKKLLMLFCAMATANALAAEPITNANWMSHPDIVAVRALYQEAQSLQTTDKLKEVKREFEFCEPGQDTSRALYTKAADEPRIYRYEGGSDDSSVTRELYYDTSGILRFAFITASASNGTTVEHRVYFSATAKKIWEIQKKTQGPGYTFPTTWPDADLIADPVSTFDSPNSCPETTIAVTE